MLGGLEGKEPGHVRSSSLILLGQWGPQPFPRPHLHQGVMCRSKRGWGHFLLSHGDTLGRRQLSGSHSGSIPFTSLSSSRHPLGEALCFSIRLHYLASAYSVLFCFSLFPAELKINVSRTVKHNHCMLPFARKHLVCIVEGKQPASCLCNRTLAHTPPHPVRRRYLLSSHPLSPSYDA